MGIRRILSGSAWLGFYLALIMLPLLLGSVFRPAGASTSFPINLSAGLCYVGFAIMALKLALISLVQRAASAFGLDVLHLAMPENHAGFTTQTCTNCHKATQ